MPNIRSSADLRNGYNEIFNLYHKYNEPVLFEKISCYVSKVCCG